MNNRGFFLQQTDRDHVWHPFSLPGAENILVKKTRGIYIYDQNNKKYIDAVSSWWVNVHGHGNLRLKNVLARQFRQIDHVIFSGFTHEPGIRLAQQLVKQTHNAYSRVFYSDNGSTAVEVALKLALQYFVQNKFTNIKILALQDAYHGDTFGAMAAGARSIFNHAFAQHMFDVEHLPLPSPATLPGISQRLADIRRKHEAVIFIYEPLIQGSGGMNMYAAPDLATLLAEIKKGPALCIADEVMTGFYRTGTFIASEQVNALQANIAPDMVCLSKGITGGIMPLGATLVNEAIAGWFAAQPKESWFYHGHSYTGNPLACALGVESLKLFDKAKLENIAQINQWHTAFAQALRENRQVKQVQVCGTILRFEITGQDETGYTNNLRDKIYNYFLANGILLRPLGNVVYIMPPYIITQKEMQYIYRHIGLFLESLEN